MPIFKFRLFVVFGGCEGTGMFSWLIKPLTVAHEIEPWGRACPGMLLSRGGHGQRRCITSQGVLVRPKRIAHNASHWLNSFTRRRNGWMGDYSHLSALALLDRTAVQGTSPRGD